MYYINYIKPTSCASLDLLSQVIYLLLDVMYSFPNKEGASVESFPTAFAIPIGLVKLVQGLWLLDHHDHQVNNDPSVFTVKSLMTCFI